LLAMMRDEDKQAQIIALLEPCLARNGNDIDLFAALGRSYAELGNHRRAIELLNRYIALRLDDGEAYAKLTDLYKSTDDTTSRIVSLKRSVEITPNLSRALELAGLYREQRRPTRSSLCCRILKVS
jgi:tetratricopeptide (TPR) repeat protein